jgi:hypothetical protein
MGLEGDDAFRAQAEEEARQRGWAFEEIAGSMRLLNKLFRGEWDDDFLVLEPGQTLRATHDDAIIGIASPPSPRLDGEK